MRTWTPRIIAAMSAPIMGLGIAVVTPQTPAPVGSTADAVTVSDAQLRDANVYAAVGHIVSRGSGQECESVDALEAETALVRYVGTVDVVRLPAAEAWTKAEQSKIVVFDWCKGGAR